VGILLDTNRLLNINGESKIELLSKKQTAKE